MRLFRNVIEALEYVRNYVGNVHEVFVLTGLADKAGLELLSQVLGMDINKVHIISGTNFGCIDPEVLRLGLSQALDLRVLSRLHAKLILVKGSNGSCAIIGSANLTDEGLQGENIELVCVVCNKLTELEELFQELYRKATTLTPELYDKLARCKQELHEARRRHREYIKSISRLVKQLRSIADLEQHIQSLVTSVSLPKLYREVERLREELTKRVKSVHEKAICVQYLSKVLQKPDVNCEDPATFALYVRMRYVHEHLCKQYDKTLCKVLENYAHPLLREYYLLVEFVGRYLKPLLENIGGDLKQGLFKFGKTYIYVLQELPRDTALFRIVYEHSGNKLSITGEIVLQALEVLKRDHEVRTGVELLRRALSDLRKPEVKLLEKGSGFAAYIEKNIQYFSTALLLTFHVQVIPDEMHARANRIFRFIENTR